MARRPDWEALGRLFDQSGRSGQPPAPSALEDDHVVYLGESMPKWLAKDLIQERIAILECDAHFSYSEALKFVRRGHFDSDLVHPGLDTGARPNSLNETLALTECETIDSR